MATNTTNYNFKKPDESDFYSVQDQNNNWDKADAALKDLDTPTFEDYSGSTTVPDAATAINNIRSKGKLSTILSNMKAAFKGACLIGQIVNNCVTNNAKLPLSAAQGKALMDLYTQLNSDLAVGVMREELIALLTSPSQLTHAGMYAIETVNATVNANAGANAFTDYGIGDFHALLLGSGVDNTGCTYGILLVTSPRLAQRIWICNIWDRSFKSWHMVGI